MAYIFAAESIRVSSTTFTQSAQITTEFGEIKQSLNLLRRSRSFKVTEFGTNRKLICDFLLVEQRKMIFYNKTLLSNNIVLRILCTLHRNEAQKLSSMYHIFRGHSSNIDIKRAVWSRFVGLLAI